MGIAIGFVGDALKYLRWGAVLHDIGKVAIPDNILNKPGLLTDEERAIMQDHVTYAYELLAPLSFPKGSLIFPITTIKKGMRAATLLVYTEQKSPFPRGYSPLSMSGMR